MKTTTHSLRKSAIFLFAFRFALVIGFLVFTVSIGNSQVDKTYVTSNPSLVKPVEKIQTVVNTPIQNPNDDAIYKNMGTHAPDVNDPDFRTKMEVWEQNYPEEFNAWMLRTVRENPGTNSENYPVTSLPQSAMQQKITEHGSVESDRGLNNDQNVNRPPAIVPQKVAEHAPLMSDPDYDAKKLEWMKNYPEEYNACMEKSTKPNTGLNAVTTTPVQKPSVNADLKVPSLNNTNVDAQNDERMKNYSEEVTSKPFTGLYSDPNKVAPKPATKIAEHAPYQNDPDYAAKKAEWIKNYPQEYEQSLNSSIPQNK